MDLQYYAHVRENANGRKEYQTVAQHLTGTAELCREFAAAFGAEADDCPTTSVNARLPFRIIC